MSNRIKIKWPAPEGWQSRYAYQESQTTPEQQARAPKYRNKGRKHADKRGKK